MAASGKSTFASKHPTYSGYHIVDYAERLPSVSRSTNLVLYLSRLLKPLRKLVRDRPEMIARSQEKYFSQAFEYINSQNEPIVVLGRRPPNEFEELLVHDTIKFAMVLIPEEDHRRNCASRKKELRNPLPFFHHWTTDFDRICEIRNNLTDYVKQHGIPVYESFAVAIDNMHERSRSD